MRSEAFAFLDAGCQISLKLHSIDAVALAVDASHWLLEAVASTDVVYRFLAVERGVVM
jgi:hypothetical protein